MGRPEGGGGLRSQVSAAGTEEVGFLAIYLLEVGVGESLVKGLRLQPLPGTRSQRSGGLDGQPPKSQECGPKDCSTETRYEEGVRV